jgi:uncharacterized protein YndB with AHSA1/START domain
MTPAILHKQIRIKASAAQVWPYIGTQEGLRQWWGTDVSMEAKVGGACEERSQVKGTSYHLQGEVTAYAPPRHLALVLRNTDHGATWPALTTLRITLQDEGEETLVTLVHQAFGAATEPPRQIDDHTPSPVAEPTRPVIIPHRVHGHPLAGQPVGAAMPLQWQSPLTVPPLLAGPLPATVGRQRWLEAQRVGWSARFMRLIGLSTERAR